MNEDGPQNLVPVFIFEIVFETSVEKWPKKFGPYFGLVLCLKQVHKNGPQNLVHTCKRGYF